MKNSFSSNCHAFLNMGIIDNLLQVKKLQPLRAVNLKFPTGMMTYNGASSYKEARTADLSPQQTNHFR